MHQYGLSCMTDIPKSRVRQLVMQLINCVIFLLGLAILSATFGAFVTIAHRELITVTNSEISPENKLEHGVSETRTDEEIRSNVFAGRKMALGLAIMEKDSPKDDRSKPSSGAKHSVGKCARGARKDLSMNCYFRSRKLPPAVNFDGHIPFTADYRTPRHHPPKNN
ncbi:hypothetical protein GUJ93_ZPchr0006g40852 [Zizania palustris]|uniref:Uncharacterized protein n=1 Tax=Zizania palustris TaxID=103762 RepID=A0A8J5ST50_ZIZPA|nr:hypothetical protein GUJ93_ZPchr0006g40852 [Zizania palustris]